MPSHLPRKDATSYENLVEKVIDSPPRPPTWPMVPLSETDIPTKQSAISFQEPVRRESALRASKSAYELSRASSVSSIGRYTDGTISRKPTMRASAMQARLDRAATSQVRSPDVSPKTAAPPKSTTNRIVNEEPSSLQRAVTGLHKLMHEALTVATEAAEANQTHEVAQILNEATLALRNANTVQSRMPVPLQLTDPELGARSSEDYISGSGSDISVESDTSSIGRGSHETAPTNYTKSRSAISIKPNAITYATPYMQEGHDDMIYPNETKIYSATRRATVHLPFRESGRRPTSQKAVLDASSADNLAPPSSDDKSIGKTPPITYHQSSAGSAITDWAYVKRVPGRRQLRDGSIVQRAADSSSDELVNVVAPAPIRVPTQDQMSFLSRSSPAAASEVPLTYRSKPVDLPEVPRQRTTRQSTNLHPEVLAVAPPPPPPPPNRSDLQQISYRQPSHRHGHRLGHVFESPYYKLSDKERDGFEGSESRYGESSAVKSPNMSLRHPRRNHISIADNQTFRLHRYRRQPIAREWSTTRKRLTAAIACLNTALVGLTAGVYVSAWIVESSNHSAYSS